MDLLLHALESAYFLIASIKVLTSFKESHEKLDKMNPIIYYPLAVLILSALLLLIFVIILRIILFNY